MGTDFILGLVVTLLIPLLAGAVAWGRIDAKIKDGEKDRNELTLRLDKMDETREGLKREYLTKEAHIMLCETSTLKVENTIRESADEVKGAVEETITDFQAVMKQMMDDMGRKIDKSNGG